MVDAYILISAEPGTARDIFEKVKELDLVKSVEAVTGSYDLVAKIRADSLEKLTETVFSKIRGLKGVTSTSTLTVVEF
ncbi:hypothetical protein AKJ62_00325 [candidate division MSBL1 archaeon SCGC-AAA259D14]|uniref:Transcription regulator AsnC/Lrp ligand binding domain-containing protein n=2 Tax=candidate division MSBL1 TaxID=215777 RepID=A0A133U8Z9_9EURY|nr:hypothetical protein AKJ62_00325 [candidate division MSBL1 archaeon SCGC-AAA259D14]KXA93844.1 hypothetical protein AKJ66_00725 [candidate division MSBL1 archaeon SCGC-AAA259E22]